MGGDQLKRSKPEPDILQADDEMKEKSIAILQDLFQVKQYFQEERCLCGRQSD